MGPHNADRFAYDYNTKCKYFNSRFWCPGTAGIDSFTVNWGDKNNWIVSPPSIIPKVINKIKREKCSCTLVVPEWTSAPYWPMTVNKQSNIREYIVEHNLFSRRKFNQEIPGVMRRISSKHC